MDRQGEVRSITVADIADVLRLVELPGLTASILAAELDPAGPYRWLGLARLDGGLDAVHRSMIWGDYLLLKGVFVDEAARGTAAALRLAFELRARARSERRRGIVAWVGANTIDRGLMAQRLRLRETSPWINRYLIPVGPGGADVPTVGGGSLVVDQGAGPPIVADLLGSIEPDRQRVHWVVDRDRLSLSGLPCAGPDEIAGFVADLAPLAKEMGVSFADIPVPAADIPLALWLATTHARRVSRTSVKLSRLEFPVEEDSVTTNDDTANNGE